METESLKSTDKSAHEARFNNGDRPLICACIGHDDPHRGDSKGAVMLAQLIAEIVDGDYLYLDNELVQSRYPNRSSIEKCYKAFLAQHGSPDLYIGKFSYIAASQAIKNPVHRVEVYNESLSDGYDKADIGLVAHHLTDDLLAQQACELMQRYPNYQTNGEKLIAIMVACKLDDFHVQSFCQNLVNLAEHHEHLTYFICPSRRSRSTVKELENALLQSKTDNITIVAEEWEHARDHFNPYIGLLGLADEIILAGDSGSIASEALFTGKQLFLAASYFGHKMIKKGYAVRFDGSGPLQSKEVNCPNIAHDIAKGLARKFLDKAALRNEKSIEAIIPKKIVDQQPNAELKI